VAKETRKAVGSTSSAPIPVPADPDFRLFFESAPGLFLVLDPDFVILAATNEYVAASMTDREALIGRNVFDVFPDNPDDAGATGQANLRDSLERVVREGRPDTMAVQKYDIRRPASEGGGFEHRYWSPANTPVLDAAGRVRLILHRVEDVTEYVRLQDQREALDRDAEHHRLRADRMEAEVMRRAQEIQRANTELRQAQGELETRVARATAELRQANAELAREVRAHRQTGWALRAAEDQFRQAQKMEAVGRLAGGVAHDFNNLLSVILSYSDILLDDLPEGSPLRVEIREIERAGERAAALTRQLLAFSRQQMLEARVLDLNEVVQETEKMVGRLLGEDVEVVLTLGNDLPRVKIDPGQIDQVLLNLAVNARDAMPGGGRLTIATGRATVKATVEDRAAAAGVEPGTYATLTVSDTGVGMESAMLTRIFEPFFTTKDKGKGTGLGLSTVLGIVQQSGGQVCVDSEVGRGSTFVAYLPETLEQESALREATEPATLDGSETILLVEDQDDVRRVAREILRRHGYDLLVAARPAEALQLAAEHRGPIHLLLSDVVMPQMSGPVMAKLMAETHPETRVLFMSGHAEKAVVDTWALGASIAFLAKPLLPDRVARRVREVLDAED